MSIPDTKSYCYSNTRICADPIQVAHHEIERVSRFRYMPSGQHAKLRPFRLRGHAWSKLSKLHVWDDECISRGIKCTVYRMILQSTLLYASETWAFPK